MSEGPYRGPQGWLSAPPPPKRKRTALVVTMSVVLVAVLVTAGLVVVGLTREEDGAPSSAGPTTAGGAPTGHVDPSDAPPAALDVAWQQTDVAGIQERVAGSPGGDVGTAVTDEVVFAAGALGVVAYVIGDGTEKWEWQAPEDGPVCAYAAAPDAIYLNLSVANTSENNNPTTAIDDYVCGEVVSLGNDGKERWRAPIPDEWRSVAHPELLREFAATGDQVIAVATMSATSFSAADGAQLWRHEIPKDGGGFDCQFSDAIAGAEVLATSTHCGHSEQRQLEVRSLADGSQHSVGDSYLDEAFASERTKLVHASSAGIVLASAETNISDPYDELTFFDPSGKKLNAHKIPKFDLHSPHRYRNGHRGSEIQIVGDVLIAYRRLQNPVAFHLRTGEQLWELAGDNKTASGMLVFGSSLYVSEYVPEFDENDELVRGYELVPYDLETGKPLDEPRIKVNGLRQDGDLNVSDIDVFIFSGGRIVALDTDMVWKGFAAMVSQG